MKEIISSAGTLWQHVNEFAPFLEWIRDQKITSILEIGTGLGGSAYCFSEATDHQCRIVSVDFAQRHNRSIPNFTQILGGSRTDEVEAQVLEHGPFDMVFFDTEHPIEECEENFKRYGKLATRFVAQHDINADEQHWPDMGIPKFWRGVVATAEAEGREVFSWVNPSPDPRFPRWGGIGAVRV